MNLGAFLPDPEIRVCVPSYRCKIKNHVPYEYKGIHLVRGYDAVAFFYQVAGFIEKKAENIELVMPPFMGYLLKRYRMNPGVYHLAGAAPEIMALSRPIGYPVPVLLEYPQYQPVAFNHLVIRAHVLVGVSRVHYVPQPEDIVSVPPVFPLVGGGHVSSVKLPQVLKVPVGQDELLPRRKPPEPLVLQDVFLLYKRFSVRHPLIPSFSFLSPPLSFKMTTP